jgi:hypothetical protein
MTCNVNPEFRAADLVDLEPLDERRRSRSPYGLLSVRVLCAEDRDLLPCRCPVKRSDLVARQSLGLDEKVGFNVEHHRMANGHDVVYIDVARA